MSGELGLHGGVIFKASINNASLPTIQTSSVPLGKTWLAHGVCKLVEALETDTDGVTTATSTGAANVINKFGTEGAADSGTEGAADSGTTGGNLWNCGWIPHTCARYCAHYCARYCAHYCARYCGLAGYGYGYGTARGYSATCTAIAVHGSSSWTQVVPTGFTVTSWLYYEEEANA